MTPPLEHGAVAGETATRDPLGPQGETLRHRDTELDLMMFGEQLEQLSPCAQTTWTLSHDKSYDPTRGARPGRSMRKRRGSRRPAGRMTIGATCI